MTNYVCVYIHIAFMYKVVCYHGAKSMIVFPQLCAFLTNCNIESSIECFLYKNHSILKSSYRKQNKSFLSLIGRLGLPIILLPNINPPLLFLDQENEQCYRSNNLDWKIHRHLHSICNSQSD